MGRMAVLINHTTPATEVREGEGDEVMGRISFILHKRSGS
jgi:hypothetical protein